MRWSRFWYYKSGYVKIKYLFSDIERKEIGFETETLWSKSLGDNLYQLQNIPEFAENLLDIVICQENSGDIPIIMTIFKQSGNRTLRVQFREETSPEEALEIIRNLKEKKVFYEKAGRRRYMFNIDPNLNYEIILDFLKSKEKEELLWVYE